MKKSIILLTIIIVITALCSCTEKEKTYHSVIYTVDLYPTDTTRIIVVYKDSSEYINLLINQNWSKEVRMQSKELASLLVAPLTSSKFFEEPEVTFTAKIIHDNKTVSESGRSLISIYSFMDD